MADRSLVPRNNWTTVIGWARELLNTYKKMTVRQLYYQLISNPRVIRTKSFYEQLDQHLTKLRWSDELDWAFISDESKMEPKFLNLTFDYDSKKDIENALKELQANVANRENENASLFKESQISLAQKRLNEAKESLDFTLTTDADALKQIWVNQAQEEVNEFETEDHTYPFWVNNCAELWIEKTGLVSTIEETCESLQLPIISLSGYGSCTQKKQALDRFDLESRPVTIFHLADHDPQGLRMTQKLKEDLGDSASIVRLALNYDQIQELYPLIPL